MELGFQNFVDIFQIVARLGTTGALIYVGLTLALSNACLVTLST